MNDQEDQGCPRCGLAVGTGDPFFPYCDQLCERLDAEAMLIWSLRWVWFCSHIKVIPGRIKEWRWPAPQAKRKRRNAGP